jgi:PAS domain S-box-containing protein
VSSGISSDSPADAGTVASAASAGVARVPAWVPLIVAALVFAIGGWLFKLQYEALLVERDAVLRESTRSHAALLERFLSRSLSGALILGAIVRENDGDVPEFERLAGSIISALGGIANLQLAPGAVIGRIHPIAGNEKAIGHRLLIDDERMAEARKALENRRLTVAGPFLLVQGGVGLVGRNPVFLNNADGSERFWGFASALVLLDEVLDGSLLGQLASHGLGYRLTRPHPDTGVTEVIHQSAIHGRVVAAPVHLPNAIWTLEVGYVNPSPLPTFLFVFLGFTIVAAGGTFWITRRWRLEPFRLQLLVEKRTADLGTSEQRFWDYAAASSQWFWETDAEHRFVWMSDSVFDATGNTPESHYGKQRVELVSKPGAGGDFQEHIARLNRHEPFRGFVFSRDGPVGQTQWLRTNGVPLFDDGGAFTGYRGVAELITAEVEIREAARLSHERFAGAIHSLDDPLALFDADDRMVICNEAYLRLNEPVREQIRPGVTFAEILTAVVNAGLMPGVDPGSEALRHHLADHHKSREPFEVDWQDGRRLLVSDQRIDTGERVLLMVEITELYQARQQIESNRQRLQLVLDHVDEGIVTMNVQGFIESANCAAEQMFGYDAGGLDDVSVANLMPPTGRGANIDGMECYLRSGEAVSIGKGSIEQTAQRCSGEEFPVRVSIGEFLDENGTRRFVGTIRDLSVQRETEAQLFHARKMEAIGQLTGGVAHDFNNVLGIVTGNISLAAGHVDPDSKLAHFLDEADRAAWRGAELVKQLLAFARKQLLRPEAVNVGRMLRETEPMFRHALPESIVIETVLAPGDWAVRADPAQLEAMVLNLAINARDAMPDGGKLTIEAANVRLGEEYVSQHFELKPGQYVMIAVTDTGIGIPAHDLEKVFEPFFSTKGPGDGSGLGLSMVYGFAKQSNGHVNVYSELGIGTTFKVYLPRDSGAESTVESQKSNEVTGPGGDESVLIVEDDTGVRTVMVAMLIGLGYDATGVPNSGQALELLRGDQVVDLLITDIVLAEDIRGYELAKIAAQLRPDITVLYVSGYTENAVVHNGELGSGVELLTKPFTIRSLALATRRLLDAR